MDGNSIFVDLSRYFLNEEVTKLFTRRRILKQIRESIVSKVVTKASTDVFLSFVEKYNKKEFPCGVSNFSIPCDLNDEHIDVDFVVYNAKSKKELNDEFPEAFTGGSNFSDKGAFTSVNVSVGLVNGQTSKEKLYSVHGIIQHEVNHIYQQFCRKSSYGHTGLMVNAKTNLFSGDHNRYVLGVIAYASDNSERQGFCNELYVSIMNHFRRNCVFSKDECAAYIWLNNLQKAYQYLLKNKDNILLQDAIEKFRLCNSMNLYNFDDMENLKQTNREHLSDYGKWTYSKFKSVANNTIQKFEDEIRYTIGKAVNDANEEGLLPRTDCRDYYSFFL